MPRKRSRSLPSLSATRKSWSLMSGDISLRMLQRFVGICVCALFSAASVASFQLHLLPVDVRGHDRTRALQYGLRSLSKYPIRSFRNIICSSGVQAPDLNKRIAKFYDETSSVWEDVWGEHMHMGYYGIDGKEKKTDARAQIDMVDQLLEWGIGDDGNTPSKVLDAGCGVGGSSRHIARKFGSTCIGVTLSPVQCEHAKERSLRAALSDKTEFQVADALNLPFEDNIFDLVWSLESGEHMPDKSKWLKECQRVLKPGGRLLIATWVHKDTGTLTCGHSSNPNLTDKQRRLLDKICKYYALPQWVELGDYVAIANQLGYENIRTDDWTAAIGPFWPAVWRSALSWRGVKGVIASLRMGASILFGTRAVLLMMRGFDQGLIRLGLITCTKA